MYELKIPNNLESIIEVKITKIYKNVGDSISIDEVFCEIETDKVSIEVTSQESGTIHSINIKEQDTISKDKVLAIIDTQNSSIKKTNKSKNQLAPTISTITTQHIPHKLMLNKMYFFLIHPLKLI